MTYPLLPSSSAPPLRLYRLPGPAISYFFAENFFNAVRSLNGREQVIKRLSQGGMGERCIAQNSERHVSQHRDVYHQHQLSALYAEHRSAEYPAALRSTTGHLDGGRYQRYSLMNLSSMRCLSHQESRPRHKRRP
jgi:hypothetical protein